MNSLTIETKWEPFGSIETLVRQNVTQGTGKDLGKVIASLEACVANLKQASEKEMASVGQLPDYMEGLEQGRREVELHVIRDKFTPPGSATRPLQN